MSILTVCTANLCRSPLLERVLQGSLDRELGPRTILVASAGTRARAGVESPAVVCELVAANAGDPTAMVSRELTPELVGDAELVLAATREHRAAVVRLNRSGLRTAFTVREFGRLLDGLQLPVDVRSAGDGASAGAADLAGLVRAVAARRGTLPPVSADDDAVPDPIGRGRDAYDAVLAQLLPIVGALTAALVRTPHR